MSRAKKQLSSISVPSQIVNSLSSSSLKSLLISLKKVASKPLNRVIACRLFSAPLRLWFVALFLVALFGMLRFGYNLEPLIPISSYPCANATWSRVKALVPGEFSKGQLAAGWKPPLASRGFSTIIQWTESKVATDGEHRKGQRGGLSNGIQDGEPELSGSIVSKLQPRVRHEVSTLQAQSYNGSGLSESEFWKQPAGMGYQGCLEFGEDYRRETGRIMAGRRKYLVVLAAGGLNQQRNQIVDAVVIARILEATLVLPILQVNLIWRDESEFSDIFDVEQFKRVLADDVRVVSSLPSRHLRKRPLVDSLATAHITPDWIRARYLRKLDSVGMLLLSGLDSSLSKDLPADLQKLRCKVAFQALRFAPGILELGNKLAERMHSKGPYLALHLRMEKDVWVRTGCLPGLSPEFDELINIERKRHPELLTGKSNMSYRKRKLAGLCPLNAVEVTRLLKALGAPRDARIYWAGGQPFGGREALSPLATEFPNFYNKEDIALPGELEPFANQASIMAAIDYIICEKSDVFMPSHGGNMGRSLQGQRAYAGHKKYITPNKRQMLHYFMNSSLPDSDFNRIIRDLHRHSLGQPDLKKDKLGRDVTKFPIPHCMCNSTSTRAFS